VHLLTVALFYENGITCLPTELLGQIFELVMVKILSLADKLLIPIGWESVYQN
jgi:hypothetical protein